VCRVTPTTSASQHPPLGTITALGAIAEAPPSRPKSGIPNDVPGTRIDQPLQRGGHRFQDGALAFKLFQLHFGQGERVGIAAVRVMPQRQQRPNGIQRKAQRPRSSNERQRVEVGAVEPALPRARSARWRK
jgi:hypothetical protein